MLILKLVVRIFIWPQKSRYFFPVQGEKISKNPLYYLFKTNIEIVLFIFFRAKKVQIIGKGILLFLLYQHILARGLSRRSMPYTLIEENPSKSKQIIIVILIALLLATVSLTSVPGNQMLEDQKDKKLVCKPVLSWLPRWVCFHRVICCNR